MDLYAELKAIIGALEDAELDGYPLTPDLIHADEVLAQPSSTRMRASFLEGELTW